MYFVNTRWLGGTLTNFQTIKQSVGTLLRFEEMEETGEFEKLSKKEASRLQKYYAKLKKNLGGIKEMDRLPSVLFVIDSKKEAIAVREAARLGITCIAIVDTNADPDAVALPIPGNDDAIRAVNLFCSVIADAAIEGGAEAEKKQAEEMARSGQLTPAPDQDEAAKTEPAEEPEAETPAEGALEESVQSAEAEADEPAAEESEGDD
jgi:small subunit ribosomal protein S2